MTNLKLLLSEQDLHNLRNASVALNKHMTEVLIPMKDTISGEIRRYINIHRKMEVAIRETDKLISAVKVCIGGYDGRAESAGKDSVSIPREVSLQRTA